MGADLSAKTPFQPENCIDKASVSPDNFAPTGLGLSEQLANDRSGGSELVRAVAGLCRTFAKQSDHLEIAEHVPDMGQRQDIHAVLNDPSVDRREVWIFF